MPVTLELDNFNGSIIRRLLLSRQKHLMSVCNLARARGNELVLTNSVEELKRVDALLLIVADIPEPEAEPMGRDLDWERRRDVSAGRGGPLIDGHGRILKP